MTAGGAGLILKCPVVFALEWTGQIRDCGRMTGKPEVVRAINRLGRLPCFLQACNRESANRRGPTTAAAFCL